MLDFKTRYEETYGKDFAESKAILDNEECHNLVKEYYEYFKMSAKCQQMRYTLLNRTPLIENEDTEDEYFQSIHEERFFEYCMIRMKEEIINGRTEYGDKYNRQFFEDILDG